MKFLLILCCLPLQLFCLEGSDLMRDLMIVDCVNQMVEDKLPVTFNHYLQGGYLNMPSARMADEGDFGVGYSSVSPYHNVSMRFQLSSDIELTGSYRLFRNLPDPILSPFGFGDFSDRGVNVKIAILHPEETGYLFPGIAIGLDDFAGTKAFQSRYIVLTQVWPKRNLEMSLGYGQWRLKGLFGGLLWMPWRNTDWPWLSNLAFVAEYDASDYKNPKREHHPDGRTVSCRVNLGAKLRVWDCLDLSASWVRGEKFACAASLFYNFGDTQGLLPKLNDPLPYCAPINVEPLGVRRPGDVLAQDLAYALRHHGFELLRLYWLIDCCGERVLRLVVYNMTYYWECDVRQQLQGLLSCLIPSDIDRVIVECFEQGCSVQEYHFRADFLHRYRNDEMCEYELRLVSPWRDVTCDSTQWSELLFSRGRAAFCPAILPKTQFLFGSSQGKFKYAVGVSAGADGYLPWDLYYRFSIGYLAASNINNTTPQDRLNPSQLPNVQTDLITYLLVGKPTVDEGFVQKNWNLGCGLFGRLSAGLFSQMYGGGDAELLYYPVNHCWAIGLDGAYLCRRTVSGIGFTSRIRKLQNNIPTYIKFPLYQAFLDLYYNWYPARLDFKVSSGRFLAGDLGSRFEISRNYDSGLRLTFWYTLTNAHDIINGKVYYDTGVGFTMPLDIFYTCSARQEWGTAISAWLRDCGYRTYAGDGLYNMIQWTRR